MTKPPRPIDLRAFPVSGMRDTLDPTPEGSRKALFLQNVYAPVPNAMLNGRPGITHAVSAGLSQVQLLIQFTKISGIEYSITVAGGLVYQFTTASVTPTQIPLPAGYTLRTTGLVYGVVFADQLVISDGISNPIMWNGSAWTIITECPPLYGQPEVYYAKLIGINALNRLQLVWSEEMIATIGYLNANYENQWQLGQAGQAPLFAIKATNEALYFFRSHSIGSISGPVETEFRTDGTREAVSGSVGTKLPSSVVYRAGEVWFLDADGRPHVIPIGGQPRPIWEDYQETLRKVDRDRLNKVAYPEGLMIEHPSLPLMLVVLPVVQGTPGVSGNQNLLILTYDTRTYEAAGIWKMPINPRSFGVLKDAFGFPMLLQGNYAGQIYRHTRPVEGQWNDLLPESSVVEHKVTPNHIGWEMHQDKHFSEITMIFRGPAITAELTYETPYATRTTPLAVVVGAQGGVLLGAFMLGTNILGDGSDRELRRKVGLRALGRWIRPSIRHAVSQEPFRFLGFELDAYLIGNPPTLK